MTLASLVARIVEALERAGIPYMITGSLASSFHGLPRATRDVDIVVEPTPEALRRFTDQLGDGEFYVDAEVAEQALLERTQFNAIEVASGWKVDLIIRKERPFSVTELARRQPAQIAGRSAFVATAEDTILAKLEWARAGESELQLRDVAGIVSLRSDELDRQYLERWIRELGLDDLWTRVIAP